MQWAGFWIHTADTSVIEKTCTVAAIHTEKSSLVKCMYVSVFYLLYMMK